MYKRCPEEYGQLIEEYRNFLQHYAEVVRLCELIKTLVGQNAQQVILYERAFKAHIEATNAYIRLVAIYRVLVQKSLEISNR